MINWAVHIHLIAAIAWIGGAIFMFVLGIFMRDEESKKEVYPRIGPLFGYYQVVALIILLTTGLIMVTMDGLWSVVLHYSNSPVVIALQKKLILVGIVIVLTIIHFYMAYKTNGTTRTLGEHLVSRSSSLLIFLLNLWILHYAIIIHRSF